MLRVSVQPAQLNCRNCRGGNPPEARFCNQCGVPLATDTSGFPQAGDAERRQITVMFVDVVGSTAMASSLDAEDYRDFINEYHAVCGAVVADFGGLVSQYLGDGVMVYFGEPEAHDDDPRRATEAGLQILERVKALDDRLQLKLPHAPQFRIGIHTGVAVIGRIASGRERMALGETPNLAARLQQLAEPNTIVVSEATRALIEGYFELVPLGREKVKGLEEPVAVHRVERSTGAQTRVEAKGPQLTPLVGRDLEVAALLQEWNAVTGAGSSSIVLVSGEPGIGKSRLVQTLKRRVDVGCTLLEGYCSPLHQNTVLRPISQALETAARLGSVVDPADKRAQLARYLSALDSEAFELVASVLSLPVPEDAVLQAPTPAIKRQRTMQALIESIRSLAAQAPLLLVIEDVHWADPSTLEFLSTYVDSVERGGVLMLVTCRPEFSQPWQLKASLTIKLQRFAPDLAAQMIGQVALGNALPAQVVDRVVDLTDGVPLYLEEVTKAVLESAALGAWNGMPEMLVPATVQDSLTARLDRLGDTKPVAQLAAILGREFSYELLRAMALMEDATLDAALVHLRETGLLVAEDRNGSLVYRFKHALIQEAAYQSLLKSRRRQYHHRVASVLRDRFPQQAEAQPDLIAQHHARAELPELAALYFEKAGAAAFRAQAYTESINHFRNSLEQLEKAPATKDRDRRELVARAGLGLPLLMTKGYAAPEVEETYGRALDLCIEVDPPVSILFGVWGAQLVRGDRAKTQQMAQRFWTIAQQSKIAAERIIAWAAVGSHAFWKGQFDAALPSLSSAVDEFEPEMLVELPRDYGCDNPLNGHLYLAWARARAGQFTKSEATWRQLWTITEAARSPYLTVLALSFGAAMARDLGETSRALELSAQGIALASQHQLVFWLALARMQHGSALCESGNSSEGTTLIESGIQFCRAIGIMTPLTYYLSYMADAHLRSGAVERGLEVVHEALELTETHLDCSALPELLRLEAELLLGQGGQEERALNCLQRSLDVARQHGAGLWEVRTATSAARLLSARGQAAQARSILEGALSRIDSAQAPVAKAAKDALISMGPVLMSAR